MAERNHNFVETTRRKVRMVAGSFAPDTANPPTDLRGADFTVARTSQGLFTITFADLHGELVSAVATMQLASADDRECQIGNYVAASKTLEIRVQDDAGSGAVQDVSANANNRVNFICVFNDALTL